MRQQNAVHVLAMAWVDVHPSVMLQAKVIKSSLWDAPMTLIPNTLVFCDKICVAG